MKSKKNTNSNLPINTLSEIPTPNSNAQQIVGVTKSKGKISGYKLSSGNIISKDEGISLARQGGIKGVGISSRKGNEYLKSIPDGNDNNNLSNLPTIT